MIEIHLSSENYPASLAAIKNPPKILYARGNVDLLKQKPGVAIVGTRDASMNGLKITHRLTKFVVSRDVIIVSGFALGIDGAAHEACLQSGGKTIAVLAGGLHEATPQQNGKLAERILEAGGLWVSEHSWGTSPQKQFFPARNRIQVGLSTCSIVVECDVRSGTMIHAKYCVSESHPLFAVIPQFGNPLALRSEGPELMVRNMRAIPLRSLHDYAHIDKVIM